MDLQKIVFAGVTTFMGGMLVLVASTLLFDIDGAPRGVWVVLTAAFVYIALNGLLLHVNYISGGPFRRVSDYVQGLYKFRIAILIMVWLFFLMAYATVPQAQTTVLNLAVFLVSTSCIYLTLVYWYKIFFESLLKVGARRVYVRYRPELGGWALLIGSGTYVDHQGRLTQSRSSAKVVRSRIFGNLNAATFALAHGYDPSPKLVA